MAKESVKETNSGVKKEGDWEEIAEFGEKVRDAVGEKDEGQGDRFDDWRPRKEDRKRDMKEKTVEKASLDEKEMEKSTEGVRKDLRKASENAARAGKEVAKRENPEKDLKKASEEAARPFYVKLLKFLRRLEKTVYSWISTPLNPYYFDSSDFSASLRSTSKGYKMEVNVPDDELRENVKQKFREDE